MKLIKILSIVLLMQILSVYSTKLSAQTYYPLVDTNKIWSGFGICTGCPHQDSSSYYIKFTQDTTIKGIVYKKVMLSQDALHKNWIKDGYLRETADEKVYYLEALYVSEICYYNFNVKKGDTILPGYPFVVDSINNILIGKQLRKRFYINKSGSPCDIWIEGIGSVEYGILNAYMCGVIGTKQSFLCYSENDTLKYENPEYNLCPQIIDNMNELKNGNGELRINVYPNPVNSLLVVGFSLLEKSNIKIQIYDITGREIETLVNEIKDIGKHKIEFNAEKLNNGIYFCRLEAENMSMTKKIAVVH